jgi:hypothetical protein
MHQVGFKDASSRLQVGFKYTSRMLEEPKTFAKALFKNVIFKESNLQASLSIHLEN